MFCLFSDTLTFYERGDLEQTIARLAGPDVTRFKMTEFICTIFSLSTFVQKAKEMSGLNFYKTQRKILYGNYFVIEILEETQQIFNRDRKHKSQIES